MPKSTDVSLDALPRLLMEELKRNCGQRDRPIHLAIKGVVYDVSQAPELYGPDGPYHLFAGRKCARSLAAMDLSGDDEMLTGKTDDLDEYCKRTLVDWIRKFNGKYPIVGKVSERKFSTFGRWCQLGALGLVAALIIFSRRAK